MNHKEHLIELESRIAHQDQTIQTLGEEIYRQQKKLDHLEATCNFLVEQFKIQSDTSALTDPGTEKPPHY